MNLKLPKVEIIFQITTKYFRILKERSKIIVIIKLLISCFSVSYTDQSNTGR